jgi:integrase
MTVWMLQMLTKSTIDRAAPSPAPFVLWDDELGGFGCKVHPTGRRSFVVQYRRPGSRRLYQVTLGAYGVLTVTEARNQARKLLAAVRLGGDPLADRKASTAALTVDELVEQYVTALKAGMTSSKRLHGRTASAGYLADTLLHLERFAGAYGRRTAASIVRADVLALLNRHAGQPAVQRRMHGAIRRMYAWAQAYELVTNAPTAHIETTSPPSRERVLSLEELTRIWRAAETLDAVYSDTVKLLIATGQRRAEVAGIRWGELDLSAAALWTMPAARTKARRQHVLPLPALATEVLQRRYAAHNHVPPPQDLVLPTLSRNGGGVAAISGWNWLKRRLDCVSGVASWRLHDFRRSIVTICAEHGADVAVLDTMLNHSSSATRPGVIGTYQRATLIEPIRRVMALWDALLRDALRLPAPVSPVARVLRAE